MTRRKDLSPEQLALLAKLNPDCSVCRGQNINELTHTVDTMEPCPWCNPIIEAVYGKRNLNPTVPANYDPIPF